MSPGRAHHALLSLVIANLRAAAVGGITLAATGRSAVAADANRLAVGEIFVTARAVEHFDQPQIRLEAVINAAPDRVWSIVTDCANFKTTMPTIMASEEVSHHGDVVVCRTTLDLLWPLPNLEATTRVVQTVDDGHWQAEWTLVSGDYRYNQGRWSLTPFLGDPGRTLVVYEVLVAPKIAVPSSLEAFGKTRALPGMIRGLREQLGVSVR